MIRIHTLGGLTVRSADGKPLSGASIQPRRLAILALLARAGDRGVSRERILSLLWPDADDERGPRALAQAIYALRKDLELEDVIGGAKELRLDPALVSVDVLEFSSAISRGDDARAAALYDGPFLDGFHLGGADEFSRWVDVERGALAHDYMRSIESLARAALVRGNPADAVTWWRKITALEPLNARFTMGLMDALSASGDRAGAIKQSHVYQLLVEQELDLPPDREVMALADRLRTSTEAPQTQTGPAQAVAGPTPITTSAPIAVAVVNEPVETIAVPVETGSFERRSKVRRYALAAVALIAVAFGIGAATRIISRGNAAVAGESVAQTGAPTGARVVAVGQITSYGTDSVARALAGPVSDLLSTSLARASGLRVVSRGRLFELMRSASGTGALDTSAGGFVNAARRAGGTEIVDGTVFVRPDGRLRLDLRRVDLTSGAIGDVHTVEGKDLFALVDSGTARLVTAFGALRPSGSVADVTTRSVAAYRMYEQGMRAYFRGEIQTAHAFFTAAVAEDSLFALATFQNAITGNTELDSLPARLERARRLAARAPDRERLTILAKWAYSVSSPTLEQLADTLVTRYPTEIEGHLYTGISRFFAGEFLGAITPLERVVAMDSLGVSGTRPTCWSCEALRTLVSAYELADSASAAERQARRWVRLQPGVPAANALAEVLEAQGRFAEADSVVRAAAPADPSYDDVLTFRALHLVRAGEHDAADRLLRPKTKEPGAVTRLEAYWQLAISLREQGKLVEAVDAARHIRALASLVNRSTPVQPTALEAQIQLEAHHPLLAAALFDSLARRAVSAATSSQVARGSAWMLTHAANARVAAGDTSGFARLADSIRVLGSGSGYGRDRRLFHHVRGLLLAARRDDAAAIAEFQAAIYSLTSGYTRTNYELARVFLRNNRPRDAIAVLQPAFRGPLDASNLYLNRTELHELLADAWTAAHRPDSAAAHYSIVARVWASGDPAFKLRADSARRKLAALGVR